jgi:hypothetical protein
MISVMQKKKPFIFLDPLFRLKTKKGFGVHSPFVFNFITKVLNCNSAYYSFQKLDNIRRTLKRQHYPLRIKSRKYYRLLFRIANYVKSSVILEIGNSSALPSIYLTAPNTNALTYVINLSSDLIPAVESAAKILSVKLSGLKTVDSVVDAEQFLSGIASVDILYLSGNADMSVDDFFSMVSSKLHNDSLLIVEDIFSSRALNLYWKKICDYPGVSVTLDLKQFGIAFFSSKLNKENYRLYF